MVIPWVLYTNIVIDSESAARAFHMLSELAEKGEKRSERISQTTKTLRSMDVETDDTREHSVIDSFYIINGDSTF